MGITGTLSPDQLHFFNSKGNQSHLNISKENHSPLNLLKTPGKKKIVFFFRTGYLVINSFSSPEEIQEMRDWMAELLKGFDPSKSSVFSTKNQVLSFSIFLFNANLGVFIFFIFSLNSEGSDRWILLRERGEGFLLLWGWVILTKCRLFFLFFPCNLIQCINLYREGIWRWWELEAVEGTFHK